MDNKQLNGPRIMLIGLILAVSAFILGTILEQPYFAGNEQLNNLFTAILMVALVFVGVIYFMWGVIKSLLFYKDFQPGQKLQFISILVLGLICLASSVLVTNYRNRDDYSEEEIYCSQQYGSANTEEGVNAYNACLQSSN